MNNTLFAIRNRGRMRCAWIPSGDSRSPLICVWLETGYPGAVSTTSIEDEEPAGTRLCA
jgi:hypothetical protein